MSTLRAAIMADDLTTAIAANINFEIELAIAHGHPNAASIAAEAWPDLGRNAASMRLSRMRNGRQLGGIPALAKALDIECDDLTSTNTEAAKAALAKRETTT